MALSSAGSAISIGRWTRSNAAAEIVANQQRRSGTQALRINGTPDANRFVYQDIPINLPATETFVLSGWGMANAIPHRGEDMGGTNPWFGLSARIFYSGGVIESRFLQFNSDVRGWQFGSTPVMAGEANRGRTIERIRVYARYNHNANTAWFDQISLVREAAQTMRYDSQGNLVGVTDSNLRDTNNQFDSRNNLTRQVTRGNGTFHNTYDANNNLTRVISGPNNAADAQHNLMMQMTYDPSGNARSSTLTGRRTTDTATHTQLASNAYFDPSRNLVTSITDVNGVTQTMNYGDNLHHIMRGTPARVTDARGNSVDYAIDAATGRPTMSWQTGRASVSYFYDRGNLGRIQRRGFVTPGSTTNAVYQNYFFTYNDFGQMTRIAVGSRILKDYYYNADHSLQRRVYGNGHTVNYTYDFLGRVTTVQHRNTRTGAVHTTYTYTGDGQLASVVDSTGRRYEYSYDSLGRLSTFTERGANNALRQHGHQSYDDAGRLIYFSYHIPSIPRTHTRRYAHVYQAETGNLAYLWLPTNQNAHLYYTYDHLHRLQRRQLRGGIAWETRFAYRAQSTVGSTTQVEWIAHEIGPQTVPENNNPQSANVTLRYHYVYDTIGQITRWRDPVNQRYHNYTYDVQNQLTNEVITDLNQNVVHNFQYVYDTYGNIRSRTHNGQTTTFNYTNPQWRDLLTSIRLPGETTNRTITYDTSGNPTTWHDGRTFTWTRGRQLQRIDSPTGRVEFQYDVDGIRQWKRVIPNSGTGTIHEFYTQNGKVIAETRRNATTGVITERLEFVYDEAGRPIQFIRNGVVHNYVLNLQGDVQQIRRADTGAVVATYLYNAWGQLISSSGTLANINPLRYRGKYWCASSGFYYMQSRYYCPAIGRFINADSYVSTGVGFLGFNMFAYCNNNPVMFVDHDGRRPRCGASWAQAMRARVPIPRCGGSWALHRQTQTSGRLAVQRASAARNQSNSGRAAAVAGSFASNAGKEVAARGTGYFTAAWADIFTFQRMSDHTFYNISRKAGNVAGPAIGLGVNLYRYEPAEAVARTAWSWAGSKSGAWAGAKIGAPAGPKGVAAGGLIGAIAGGMGADLALSAKIPGDPMITIHTSN